MNIKFKRIYLLAMLFMLHKFCFSDSWYFTTKDTNYVFYDSIIKIVLNVNTINNPVYPEYSLNLVRSDTTIILGKKLGFEYLFYDTTNSFFLGLSNSGVMCNAAIIFSHSGKIIELIEHSPLINYCNPSITIDRKWFESKSVNPKFVISNGELLAVTVKDCNKKDVILFEKRSKNKFLDNHVFVLKMGIYKIDKHLIHDVNWEPPRQMVNNIDKKLKHYITNLDNSKTNLISQFEINKGVVLQEHSLNFIKSNFYFFYRQFIGSIYENKKTIKIFGYYNSGDIYDIQLANKFYGFWDGGPSKWSIKYSIENENFYDFQIN